MSKNQPIEQIENNKDQFNDNLDAQEPATPNSTPSSLSRRSFLGRVSASTAVAAAAGVGLPTLLSEGSKG